MADLPRRGHKKQAKYLDDDSKNKKLNQQHQDTTGLILEHGEFYIGDNSIARMKQKKGVIRMGKSICDNTIGQFKTLFGSQINSALIPDGHWRQMAVTAVR